MSWTELRVVWTRQAVRDLRGLATKDVAQIQRAVNVYASTGEGDCKPLVGLPGHRLRVRERRVLLLIRREDGTLIVTAVRTRGDAY